LRNILNHNIMGFIKEPKGVDFIIESENLREKDKMEISKYIEEYKAKSSSKNRKTKKSKEKLKKEEV